MRPDLIGALCRSRRRFVVEMLPERTAACSSVGLSGLILICSLVISSPMLLQPTAATRITCTERLKFAAIYCTTLDIQQIPCCAANVSL